MEFVWTFLGKPNEDFFWLNLKEFHQQFGIDEAIGYLGQIKGTLLQEAKDHRQPNDLYTGLRHAFAEIDGLGKLYMGEYGKRDTAANAVAFGKDYLGQINPRYCDLFGLLFDMYRHGLAHGHLVRSVRFLDPQRRWNFVGWEITPGRNGHLSVTRVQQGRLRLTVSVPQLVDDTLDAVDLFVDDLRKKGKRSKLFGRFKKGYLGTCIIFREPLGSSTVSPGGTRKPKRTRRLSLNEYSKPGIDWIRDNVA